MKKGSRQLALEWWNQLSFDKQRQLMADRLGDRKVLSLTGREVEIIWKYEKENKND